MLKSLFVYLQQRHPSFVQGLEQLEINVLFGITTSHPLGQISVLIARRSRISGTYYEAID